MTGGTPGSRQTVIAYARALLGAAGGAIPVVVVLIIFGVVSVNYARTDDLIVPKAVWRLAAMFAFTLAAAAVAIGLVRAAIVIRRWPRGLGPIGADVGVPWPRAETVGMIVLGLAYGVIVALVFGDPEPCEDLPYGSERTACAMGHGALYIVLVLGGLVVWALGSVSLALIWVIRTAMDVRAMLRGGDPPT